MARAAGLACILLACVPAALAQRDGVLFYESFDDKSWDTRWKHSLNGKYDGRFTVGKPDGWKNNGLRIPEASKHYGISAPVPEPIDVSQGLVLQYEVRHSKNYTCGGSYIKLLAYSKDFTSEKMHDKTPFTIMFGPDKCSDSMVRLIFKHWNPRYDRLDERHLVAQPIPGLDNHTHVYTLRLANKTGFHVLVDGELKVSGDLMGETTFKPPFKYAELIPDPAAKKPADWVDKKKIPDFRVSKPDDWDDREFVPDKDAPLPEGWLPDEREEIDDPNAKEPEGWDEDRDGIWLPPRIKNPKCVVGCGKWKDRPLRKNHRYMGEWQRPLMDNPQYRGPWLPPYIHNPEYFEDENPLANLGQANGKVGAVAVEVWTTDDEYYFDNIILSRNDVVPARLREKEWKPRVEGEKRAAKAAAAAAEAEVRAKKKGYKKLKGLPKAVVDFFSLPQLKLVKPYVKPVLKAIRRQPAIAYGVVAMPVLLFLVISLALAIHREREASIRRAVAAAYAKKFDISSKDDAGEQLDQLAGKKVVPDDVPPAPQVPAAATAAGVGKSAGGSSDDFELVEKPKEGKKDAKSKVPVVEDEDEDEEEEDDKPTTRRRARRAA